MTDQFTEVDKLIVHGKSGKRKVIDYKLSRYACYLLVQNGDPRKEIKALKKEKNRPLAHKEDPI